MRVIRKIKNFGNYTETAPNFNYKVEGKKVTLLLDNIKSLGTVEVFNKEDISLAASYLIAKQYIEVENKSILSAISKDYFPVDSEINGKEIVGTHFFEYLVKIARKVA